MLSLETQLRIDKICDQAESDWKSGCQPAISQLVGLVEASAVPTLITELIRVDREINSRPEEELESYYLQQLPAVYGEYVVGAILGGPGLSNGYPEDGDESDSEDRFNPEDFIGKSIGNYRIDKVLGVGGFGMVYRAKDKILNRHVVIKFPRGRILDNDERVNKFLDEARNIAQLRHANILNVLHVGKEDGQPYIVEEYFEDGDLGKLLKNGIPETAYTLKFISMLAEAIQFAHLNGIIHRDLKPANILMGLNGEPIVGDFGLSLHAARIAESSRHIAGTVQYMSPEQIRGETHRLDGRSDIWSVGVVLYRMLTGRLPFDGSTSRIVADQIIFGRPTPPRDLREDIDEELNRICLRCLAQRVNGRYVTAAELSEDLERLIKNGGSLSAGPLPSVIRSKGLSAFGNEDRDFFLSLLPGPLSRNGFPECIDFWKQMIERVDLTEPVGLIVGPSGCGKSSIIRAGLLPVLNDQIEVVTVNATAADTEVRLLKGLRSRFPELPNDVSLPVAIAGLREKKWMASDRRLLIVFDQFEQWLHANSGDEHPQLVHALRHCDGESVMAMILVREDFFMAVSKFFSRLEIDLVARKNFLGIDLFGEEHAKEILVKFGQALNKLPARVADISEHQNQFLAKAVKLISVDNRVMCMRLAIFVEAIKKLPWNIETLSRIGNSKEIGVYFLDEVLGENCQNPKHKIHRQQLTKALEKLLPDPGVDIKGNLCSRKELADAAGLHDHSAEFNSVLKILDSELRLITPTEPDGEIASGSPVDEQAYYQLTHDYLVPSLREWMHSIRGQTRRGRAKLRLQELAGAWDSTANSRFMPGFFEYASIVWHVPNRKREAHEKAYMKSAGLLYGARCMALTAICLIAISGFWRLNTLNRRELTSNQVDQFVSSKPAAIDAIMEQLRHDSRNAVLALETRLREDDLSSLERRRIHLGLAMLGKQNAARTKYLVEQIPISLDTECSNFIKAFENDPVAIKLLDCEIKETEALPSWARLSIVRGFLDPSRLPADYQFDENPESRTSLIHEFGDWHGDLQQVIAMLDATQDPAFLTGICLSLGRVEAGEQPSSVSKRLSERMLELYRLHPSSAVHSAAKWALNSWQIDLPSLDETSIRMFQEWSINQAGMTMIEFWSTNENGLPTRLTVSDCEIPSWLYCEFLNDANYPDHEKPSTDWIMTNPWHPVGGVNLHDAVLFCNWLSSKHGLDVCYRREGALPGFECCGDKTKSDPLLYWELIKSSSGYRLPWVHEWELAARGGTTTSFFYADREFFPDHDRYQWSRANSLAGFQEIGQSNPNAFGLFDVLGNAAEICWGINGLNGYRNPEYTYARRGGDNCNHIDMQKIDQIWPAGMKRRHEFTGFRVVCPPKDRTR